MCRNIKALANFAPPATPDEIRASALQFVRKLSGTAKPSKVNEEVFNRAVEEVNAAAERLIRDYVTNAPPRNRAIATKNAPGSLHVPANDTQLGLNSSGAWRARGRGLRVAWARDHGRWVRNTPARRGCRATTTCR